MLINLSLLRQKEMLSAHSASHFAGDKIVLDDSQNKEALVGAFSVIVKTGCGTDGSICGTRLNFTTAAAAAALIRRTSH